MTEFLRMSGIYWGATCLDIMGQLDKLDKKSIIEFIKNCQCLESGGISACDGHDPHLLYTLSAIQVCSPPVIFVKCYSLIDNLFYRFSAFMTH